MHRHIHIHMHMHTPNCHAITHNQHDQKHAKRRKQPEHTTQTTLIRNRWVANTRTTVFQRCKLQGCKMTKTDFREGDPHPAA